MGIIFGAIVGLLVAGAFYRVPTEFTILVGALFGHLFSRSIKSNSEISRLREKLKNVRDDVLGLTLASKDEKPQDKVPEQHVAAKVVEPEADVEPIAEPIPVKESNSKPVAVKPDPSPVPVVASARETYTPTVKSQASDFNNDYSKEDLQPTPVDAAIDYIAKFFTGENAVLRIGIVILFLGIAFLLKYAAENVVFPMWLRLVGVSVAATVILWFGWKLKSKRESYALMLQGAGIGILYLDIFGALKLTNLMPAPVAFFLLIFVCVFSAVLAVVQNSKSLATMGAIGGFLAPILASTGSGKYYLLFSYYILLDAGIFGIAWHKAWRSLNLVGFFFTFGIGLAWGIRDYKPEMFWNIELFLLVFFFMFVAISVLFAIKQPDRDKGYVDGTLVFGTPLLVFGLQTYLLKTLPQPYEFGLAFSALGLAVIYITISQLFAKTKSAHYVLFTEATLALGVLFGTLTIPLALNDGLWTSAAWALEGSALLWVGIRQKRMAARLFGIGLQFLAGASFLVHHFKIKIDLLSMFSSHTLSSSVGEAAATMPIINGFYMGCLTIVIAGMFVSYLINTNEDKVSLNEYQFGPAVLIWSLIWWFVAGITEIANYAAASNVFNYSIVFIMLSCLAFMLMARKLAWVNLSSIVHLAPITLGISLLSTISNLNIANLNSLSLNLSFAETLASVHPLANAGLITWPLSFAIFYIIYYFKEKLDDDCNTEVPHLIGYMTLFTVIGLEVYWRVAKLLSATQWSYSTWMLFCVGVLLVGFMALTIFLSNRVAWPFKKHKTAYLLYAQTIVAITTVVWMFVSMTMFVTNGDPAPLPYFPLVNPLELCQAFAFVTLLAWVHTLKKQELIDMDLTIKSWHPRAFGLLLFMWFNSMLVRTLGHWGGVPFEVSAMMHSALVQATFSVAWTLLAMIAMAYATKKSLRGIWYGGGAILILVVVKLFTVDLASIETLGRIISFIGVGTLLLLIGYFSPLPPKAEHKEVEVSQ